MSTDLPFAVAVEILADALRETMDVRPNTIAKMEHRKYAGSLIERLRRSSIGLHATPKVVQMPGKRLRSSKALRVAARDAWMRQWQITGDEVDALNAAVRVTLDRQPDWSLKDACRHAIEFVLPDNDRPA